MYKDVYEVVEGHLVGKITERSVDGGKVVRSFSVGRKIVGAEREQKVTYWFLSKHFAGLRSVLDKLELRMIKFEEQTS